MTWSLGVEEQFYIFFPFLLIFLSHWSKGKVTVTIALLSLISLLVSIGVTKFSPTTAFYLLPTRAWELGTGAILALLWDHPARPLSTGIHNVVGTAGLALTLLSCVLFADETPFPGIAALMPVVGAMALIFSQNSWENRPLLSSTPLVSYSWYPWHAPLLAFTRLCFFGKAGVPLLCAVAILSLGVAYLSLRFIERPFRPGKSEDRPTLRRYGIALPMCGLVPVGFVVLKGVPQRLGPQGNEVERVLATGRTNPCLVSYGNAPQCQSGGASGTDKAVILLGDTTWGRAGIGAVHHGPRAGFAVPSI